MTLGAVPLSSVCSATLARMDLIPLRMTLIALLLLGCAECVSIAKRRRISLESYQNPQATTPTPLEAATATPPEAATATPPEETDSRAQSSDLLLKLNSALPLLCASAMIETEGSSANSQRNEVNTGDDASMPATCFASHPTSNVLSTGWEGNRDPEYRAPKVEHIPALEQGYPKGASWGELLEQAHEVNASTKKCSTRNHCPAMDSGALTDGALPPGYESMQCDECGALDLEDNGEVNWHCSACEYDVCHRCRTHQV